MMILYVHRYTTERTYNKLHYQTTAVPDQAPISTHISIAAPPYLYILSIAQDMSDYICKHIRVSYSNKTFTVMVALL